MPKPLRILSMPVDDGGCGWYRIRQPLDMIQRFTPHDTHIIDPNSDNMVALVKAMGVTDIALMRQGAELGMRQLRNYPECNHLKWVLDIDDNIELISPYSQHYHEYGLEEFYDQNAGKWLWKDGQADFNIQRNKVRVLSLLQGLKEADLVTVTTPKLAEYARYYNPKVAVLPNCINFERWWRLPLKPNNRLRVGWSGGVSHYEDWYSIKEPLNRLMREHQFTLVMAGSFFPGLVDEDNKHLIELHDWVPFKGHSYRMMCLHLDIALVPLADLPFNHFKSAIKWYEMSAMGVPSIVAQVTPYKEEVEDGKTVLAYDNHQGFYKALRTLLINPNLRSKIGNEAHKWVKANRDAKKCAKLWAEAYRVLKA